MIIAIRLLVLVLMLLYPNYFGIKAMTLLLEQPGYYECSGHSSAGEMSYDRASCRASFNTQCLDSVSILRQQPSPV